jgi:MFS family permease
MEIESREQGAITPAKSFSEVFALTSWRDRTLCSVSFAGLVNNLNDGTAWGLFPLYFASGGLSIQSISLLVAIYPAVWGLGQLGTGALSDRIGRKLLIVSGMLLQGFAIILLTASNKFAIWSLSSVLLGLGTAMVYPTFLAVIGDVAHPSWRASAVGVYRLWRDSGYAIGAILAGIAADAFGIRWSIFGVGALTVVAGLIVSLTMRETLMQPRSADVSLPLTSKEERSHL